MRKWIAVLLTLALALSCGITAFAAESDDTTEIGVYAKAEYNVEGVHPAPIDDGKADVTTDDGVSVSVTDAPKGSLTLMVIPVPETEKEVWEWIEDCMKGKADPVHTFDIHFLDQDGKRLDADGAVVTLNCPHCQSTPVVCSLDSDGTVHILSASAQDKSVTFTTNGSTYYIMAEELHSVEVEDKPGGDVVIDNPNPETGDDVTITPDPDDGKVVDRVIVKDENGNEIPVKDNGDGTYTYEQPDGDVTIEVTFKDDKTPDTPQTGDNSHMPLWVALLFISGGAIITLTVVDRKRKAASK